MNMTMKNEHEACRDAERENLYRIGLFAQMNHVSVKALRFYEEEGILMPSYVDLETGYRFYSGSSMATMQKILALKEAGFTIEEIKKLMKGGDAEAIVAKKRSEILLKISELTASLSRLDSYLSFGKELISSPVLLKELPPVCCATMEKRIDSYDDLFSLMPEFGSEMENLGYECAVPDYCFTRYLEEGFKDEQIQIETCQAVTKRRKDSESVKYKEFPATTALCLFHKGSYRDFPSSYAVLLKYIEDNGYEITGAIRESYIDGVWNKESEADWLSEIQIPVKKKDN